MNVIRVLVVDDQALMRDGLKVLLSRQEGLVVCGEAANGREAVSEFERLNPDVVLMDLRMPVWNGIDATQRICEQTPGARVLVLTTFDDEEEVFAALQAGACGYLLKDVSAGELSRVIREVAGGRSFLDGEVTARVIREFRRLAVPRARRGDLPGLSSRENDVLRLLAAGRSNKEIASDLGVAEGTVKNHLTRIFSQLGVLDRTQAVIKARDLGMV
jgi:DNA-binding NarL/FixJ family response regulator